MNPGSCISSLRFPARRFPQTAPIVVSGILCVTGPSEHASTCGNLQNKQLRAAGEGLYRRLSDAQVRSLLSSLSKIQSLET